jgi:tRNA-splicing endonuclease subunit Sen34
MSFQIYIIEDSKLLVFDPESICKLQEANRICGHLIGSLANNVRQNEYYGSPLMLTNEEAKLLIVYLNAASLYKDNTSQCLSSNTHSNSMKIEYEKYLDQFYTEQNEKYKEKRLVELAPLKSKIIDGKRKSLQNKIEKLKLESQTSQTIETLTKLNEDMKALNENHCDSLFANEIKNISKVDMLTEIFLLTPKFLKIANHGSNLSNELLFTITSHLNYKYVIFKDLWTRGYYLTPGAKFGGDYLVYCGHPSLYHSTYILLCLTVNDFRNMKTRQLIHFGRMSTSVKKTFLLACVHTDKPTSNEEVVFVRIEWSRI